MVARRVHDVSKTNQRKNETPSHEQGVLSRYSGPKSCDESAAKKCEINPSTDPKGDFPGGVSINAPTEFLWRKSIHGSILSLEMIHQIQTGRYHWERIQGHCPEERRPVAGYPPGQRPEYGADQGREAGIQDEQFEPGHGHGACGNDRPVACHFPQRAALRERYGDQRVFQQSNAVRRRRIRLLVKLPDQYSQKEDSIRVRSLSQRPVGVRAATGRGIEDGMRHQATAYLPKSGTTSIIAKPISSVVCSPKRTRRGGLLGLRGLAEVLS